MAIFIDFVLLFYADNFTCVKLLFTFLPGLCGDFDGSPNNDLGGVNPEDFVAANIVPGSCTEEA